jgi:hypothetical protein
MVGPGVYNSSFQVHGWRGFMGGDGEETKQFPGDVHTKD